ncbi:hypothetical protein [Aeromicrobium sp. UC242_57]|uniref:hypothetical protein n=1 Tax=Aeromicrobium sp. UC242_57 TaxID=3374624 RepID=UPI0037B63FE5
MAWLLPLLGILLVIASALVRRRHLRDVLAAVGRSLLWVAVAMAVLLVIAAAIASRLDRGTLAGAISAATWDVLSGSFWRSALIAGVAGTVLWLTQRAEKVPGPVRPPQPRTSPPADLPDVGPRAPRPRPQPRRLRRPDGAAPRHGHLRGDRGRRRPRRHHRPRRRRPRRREKLAGPQHVRVGCGGRPPPPDLSPRPPRSSCSAVQQRLLPGRPRTRCPSCRPKSSARPATGTTSCATRTYDQVSYAATHNSMSAGDEPGWFLAEQPTGMIGQLDAGVRVFLIDTWYGQNTQRPGIVATAESGRAAALEEAQETYGPAVVESALRLRDSLNLTPSGPLRSYLCHALCELGSTEFEPESWSGCERGWTPTPARSSPFFIQDEVSPADTAKAIENAGLMPFVHTQKTGSPWPTLGSMISSGKRLVVLMENVGGGEKYPWMLDGDTSGPGHPVLVPLSQAVHVRGVPRREDRPTVPGQPLAEQLPDARRRRHRRQCPRCAADPAREVPEGTLDAAQLRGGRQLRPR